MISNKVDRLVCMKTIEEHFENANRNDAIMTALNDGYMQAEVAEGFGRNSTKEYIQFLYIALGSASEVETQIIIGQKIGYFQSIHNYIEDIIEIKKMLNGLISSLKESTMKSLNPRTFVSKYKIVLPTTKELEELVEEDLEELI